jgi:glycolate oxidase
MTTPALFRPEDLRFEFDPRELQRRLAAVLPPEGLIIEESGRRTYECDALTVLKQVPLLVAIPDRVEQVQALLRICSELGVPVVARGAGTSLSGGSLPHPQGVLLNMSRFNRVLELDPKRRLARVEPGVRNLAISEAAAPHGLFYAPDPSSQIACTIGGNIAENAGGIHCLKYGLTVNNIVQATMVTIEGELVSLGSAAGELPGFDLLALLHGSEGMLGVVVEATVQLVPRPPARRVLLAAFPTAQQSAHAVAAVIASGVIPAALELMDQASVQAVEALLAGGLPTEAAALLICELDGSETAVATETVQVEALLREHGATRLEMAISAAEQAQIWKIRKSAFPAIARISPDTYALDGAVPRNKLAQVLEDILALSQQYGLRVINTFHAGDGNIHPVILFDSHQPGQLQAAEAMADAVLTLCLGAGGTITGEHGVGMEKINQMCAQFTTAELAQFHSIKAAFDPRGLLNPGKAIPTLNRCAEFGRLHVREGRIPHPELPRF